MSQPLPKILLVEDDVNLAGVYQARMEAEGFEVKHSENGELALQAAIEFKPNLIVLDIMMPRISGFDVLDILHNTSETAAIKVIVLSALGQPADIDRAKALGASDYLIKSQASIADVMQRIRFHLGLPPAENPA